MTELNLSHKQCNIPSRMLSAAVRRFGNYVVRNMLQVKFKFWCLMYNMQGLLKLYG
jgi:hypothetical protein